MKLCKLPLIGWLFHNWKPYPVVYGCGWTVIKNRCRNCGQTHEKRAQL